MNNKSTSDEMKNLWQSQPTEPPNIHPEDFRRKMYKFERRVFWRNMREYAAGAVVVAGFGYFGWKLHGLLVRVGAGLIIAGASARIGAHCAGGAGLEHVHRFPSQIA